METRRLGPVVGLGTWNTFGADAELAREVVGAVFELGGRLVDSSPMYGGAEPSLAAALDGRREDATVELCLGDVTVAWPRGLTPPDGLERLEEVDVDGWEDACAALPLEHMGRGRDDDPWFFAAAFAAGRLARDRL